MTGPLRRDRIQSQSSAKRSLCRCSLLRPNRCHGLRRGVFSELPGFDLRPIVIGESYLQGARCVLECAGSMFAAYWAERPYTVTGLMEFPASASLFPNQANLLDLPGPGIAVLPELVLFNPHHREGSRRDLAFLHLLPLGSVVIPEDQIAPGLEELV